MGNLGAKFFSLIFLLTISSIGIITYFYPDKASSNIENRTLEQLPEITIKTILNPEFSSTFERYYSDQIYNRDFFIKTATRMELLLNKTIVNDVVVAKDGWLLNKPRSAIKEGEIDKGLANVNRIAQNPKYRDVEFYFAFSAHKNTVLQHKYPDFITNYDLASREYFLENLSGSYQVIDLYSYFTKMFNMDVLEGFYFKTDHHWNMDGAFHGYQYIIESISETSLTFKEKPYQNDDFKKECTEQTFFSGSRNRNLYLMFDGTKEEACIFVPNYDFAQFDVRTTGKRGKFDDFSKVYAVGIKEDYMDYSTLFTGDYAELKFTFPENTDKPNLLVIKDSYVNPVVHLIAQHFHHTYYVDPRHYRGSISEYIDDNKIGMVLFVYNDTNVSGEMYELD
ncbi:DHHW family protein [Alkalihalobacterium alkalicellulosilyticum]|uniref:DHHW family protein n=1 Tax=Alkalihalobacterium alkalicellulosilyticum TaxID=1912214 RepID=UPI000996D664|nr:DHHW family protein [Bacillus alkalicellulosilyticus]